MISKYKMIHLSDLHFSPGRAIGNSKEYSHSIEICRKLEEYLLDNSVDKIIISGDLTDRGDLDSLINVHDWLFKEYSIADGNGDVLGLWLDPEKLIIVPGNHDAWNNISFGLSLKHWHQKSLENFNRVFLKHQIEPELPCGYHWIEKENTGIFVAFVDSCYLGDTNTPSPEKIAKGKLSHKQSRILLRYFDDGMNGRLRKTNSNELIPAISFANSLKILVMHHYIFEPSGYIDDYFMKLKHRDLVFRNIAMADFDMLLCGHKHIPGCDDHTYGHHFDLRGKKRFLLNCFRRLIGINSMPLQLEENGKRLPRMLSWILYVLSYDLKSETEGEIANDKSNQYMDKLIDVLRIGLENPEVFERAIIDHFKKDKSDWNTILNNDELIELQLRIKLDLTHEERKRLADISRISFKKIMNTLEERPFTQVMCGSTTKNPLKDNYPDKPRYFLEYDIETDGNDFNVHIYRYEWINGEFQKSEASVKKFPGDKRFKTFYANVTA